MSPNGQTIAAGFFDKTARLYEVRTGKELSPLSPLQHKGYVKCIAFDAEGNRLATGSEKKVVRLWDVATRRELLRFQGHAGRVNSVAFSLNGEQLYSGSSDGTVKIWDTTTGREAKTLPGHIKPIHGLAFSPDSAYLVTGGDDKTVRMWNARTGKIIQKQIGTTIQKMHTQDVVQGVAYSPDGTRIAAACNDQTYIWEASTQRLLKTIPAPPNSSKDGLVTGINFVVAFSPDSKYLAIGTDDSEVRFYNTQTGQLLKTLAPMMGNPSGLAFSPDGKYLAGSSDSSACVWDAQTGKVLFPLKGHKEHVICVAFSHNGKQIATGGEDKTVIIWNAQTGKQQGQLINGEAIESVAFSPDDRRILTGDRDNLAKLWDLKEEREVLMLSGHTDYVLRAIFAPDGSRIATSSLDGTAKIWERDAQSTNSAIKPSLSAVRANSTAPPQEQAH